MPFGKKSDNTGRIIDFDIVYGEIIKPAIQQAELEPIRADEERIGGFIHKPMFERLMLCEYAVADLTTANANVFYELGIRHGIRPHSTVLLYGKGTSIPFDVAAVRALPYEIDKKGKPAKPDADREALVKRLEACRDPVEDSPLFQLVSEWPRPDISRLKTDTFRDLVEYSKAYKNKLENARAKGRNAVNEIEKELKVADADPAIIIDLLLSYRAVESWEDMVNLYRRISPILARTVLVQEQYAFALNRLGRRDEAQTILEALIREHGPSSETNGLLGRVFKDRWKDAREGKRIAEATGYLRRAIDAYLAGFRADIRDVYPGINAATLMECEETVRSEQATLLPVISYSLKRRFDSRAADYWDYATLLELYVLLNDMKAARDALSEALASSREKWELRSTADNLALIVHARHQRGTDTSALEAIENELRQNSQESIQES
jgi:tetratricopeptide (TPR) repeat protein